MKFLPVFNLKTTLKDSVGGLIELAGMALQVAVPGGGAIICFAVGKFVAGLILVCITAAVAMRLLWRRKRADHVRHEQRLPAWAQFAAVLFALIGSGVLVEMTKLPVRFDQPDFAMSNWLVVIVAIVLLYGWCRSLLRTWLDRKSPSTSLVEKQ
jgi:protein-S-isoprenylcysteine O-methyltransferase Ste14